MALLKFEWDQAKDRANQRNHGVSFAEAQTVFFDDNAVEFYDDEHSEWEDRFLLLGVSAKLRVLIVCHCLRGWLSHPNHIRAESNQDSTETLPGRCTMKTEIDLTKMKSRRNPYAKQLKRQLTIRMGVDIIAYFKAMSGQTGIPYQNLINLYLRECVMSRRKLQMKWAS